MYKKMIVFQIVFIYSLLFSSYNKITVNAYSNLIINYYFNGIYDTDERKLIAKIPTSNIKLYYLKDDEDFGLYRGFILQKDDMGIFFSWENDTNPSYAPKLTLADLDKDGNEELIIELCKGHGTGIYDGEIHVIKLENFQEILVENPAIILYKNVTLKESPKQFKIILKNKKISLNKKELLSIIFDAALTTLEADLDYHQKLPLTEQLPLIEDVRFEASKMLLKSPYSKVGIGWDNDNTRYEVKNNKLYARVILASGMRLIGEFIIKYKYEDRIFQMETIDFTLIS